MRRRLPVLTAAVLAVVGALAAAALAGSAIPGAHYKGFGADGALVTFDVSGDGTHLTQFHLVGVKGGNCELTGAGGTTPIVHGAFAFHTTHQLDFAGRFNGPQSAVGTFHIYSSKAGCDSGTVQWSATTSSYPPGGLKVSSQIGLRELSRTRVGGKVRAAKAVCVANRTVRLWIGKQRVASTTTRSGGSYSFPRSRRIRGHRVRASVVARTVGHVVCETGFSPYIKA